MSGQCLSPDVAGQPLSPATRHSLGGPLPHQLADRTWAAPRPAGPRRDPRPLTSLPCDIVVSSGITRSFPRLSRCPGYVTHVLLTLSPLYSRCSCFPVRLACFSHAASVRSEPGSNSSLEIRPVPSRGPFSMRRSTLLPGRLRGRPGRFLPIRKAGTEGAKLKILTGALCMKGLCHEDSEWPPRRNRGG